MNEHAKLFRDAFNAFALGCFGYAAFSQDIDMQVKVIFIGLGLYSHLVAHIAVSYGTLPSKRSGDPHG